jgi:hypothetical protein
VLEPHPGRVPVDVAEERLLAVVDHLDRPAGSQCQQAGVDVHGQVLAAAERAADAGEGHPDLLGGQPERGTDLALVGVQPLGGDVQVDPAVLGRYGQAGLRAQESLVLHAHLVLAHDDDLGFRVLVAAAQPQVPHQVPLWVQVGGLPADSGGRRGRVVQHVPGRVAECRHRVGDRLPHVVVDPDPFGGLPGDLGVGGGDEGHRLTLVADRLVGQDRLVGELEPVPVGARHVLGREHGLHARDRQRLADVDGPDPRERMRAAQGRSPEHALDPQVARVSELPADLQHAVRA